MPKSSDAYDEEKLYTALRALVDAMQNHNSGSQEMDKALGEAIDALTAYEANQDD